MTRGRVEKEKGKEKKVRLLCVLVLFLDGWELGSNIELTSEDCAMQWTHHTEKEREKKYKHTHGNCKEAPLLFLLLPNPIIVGPVTFCPSCSSLLSLFFSSLHHTLSKSSTFKFILLNPFIITIFLIINKMWIFTLTVSNPSKTFTAALSHSQILQDLYKIYFLSIFVKP